MAPPVIRLVRSAPDPLGLFLRVGRAGQKDLQTFIAAGDASFSGVVLEAKRAEKQKELLSLVLEHRIDAVLDPQTQAMGTTGGYTESMDVLPLSAKRAIPLMTFPLSWRVERLPTTSPNLRLSTDLPKYLPRLILFLDQTILGSILTLRLPMR